MSLYPASAPSPFSQALQIRPETAAPAGMASIVHAPRVTDAEVSAARSMAADCPALSAALDALDTARVNFDNNQANGTTAESAASEAETSWLNGGQTDELWSHVETAQRRARQCYLRAKPLLAALDRAEGVLLTELRGAAVAERAAMAEEFKATIAPMLADYAAHAVEMQAIGHRIEAARSALRVRALSIYTRELHSGTAPAGGPPPELFIMSDGHTLGNCAVRRVAVMLSRRGVSVADCTTLEMLQRCDSEHDGAERGAVDAAAEMLAPVVDGFIGDDSAHGKVRPPRPPFRVRNKHTAAVEKIKPGAVGFVPDNAGSAAMLKVGLLVLVDANGNEVSSAEAAGDTSSDNLNLNPND